MKDRVIQVLGHPLLVDLPESFENWLADRYPASCSRRGAQPIHICKGAVIWDGQTVSTDITLFDRSIQIQQTEVGFRLRSLTALLQLTIATESMSLTLSGGDDDLRLLLVLALIETARLSGLIPFHAAAIAHGDRCAILMAPSKTGKSTTLVTAALTGYMPVAEDSVWVDPDTLNVYGNDVQIRLWPDSLQRFTAMFPTATRRDADGKYLLRLDALPGYPPGDCRLHRFVVLKRDLSQASSWQSPPQLELVRAAWEAGGKPLIPRTQLLAQTGIQTLINTVPFKGLTIGNTPLDFAPMLE